MVAVTQRQPWITLAKPILATWGIDPGTDKVLIGLTKITPQITAAARSAFGDEVTLIRQKRPQLAIKLMTLPPGYRTAKLSLPHKASARPEKLPALPNQTAPYPSRLTDATPYYGGDRIYRLVSSSGGTLIIQCTVAFTWTTPGMTSAGHCGPTGTVWTQGYYDTSNNTLYNSGTMGTVQNTQWGNNRPDAELITKSSWAPYVYTSTQGSAPQGGSNPPYVGQTGVCADGSFTGQNCTGVIGRVGFCTDITDNLTGQVVYVCDLDTATSSNGSTIVQSGDSGGPVYFNDNGTLYAEGVISASSGNINPNTGADSTVYFTDIRNVISTMGGTVASAG
jgi:hypothetical protein